MRLAPSLTLAALVVAAGCTSRAAIIYNQAPDVDYSFTSQYDSSLGGTGSYAICYDDFTLGADATVNSIGWRGVYFNPASRGVLDQTNIAFWSDLGGQPGFKVASYAIPGVSNETYVHNANSGAFYDYSAALPTAFNATAGTKYWISIQEQFPFPPQWGWAESTHGDAFSYQDYHNVRYFQYYDFSFRLEGNSAVPEPGTWAFLLSAAPAALAFRRRK